MVVSNELKEPIRSHHDIDRDSVKHFKRATKVSTNLFNARTHSHSLRSSTKVLLNAYLTMVMLLTSLRVVSTKSDSWR